MAQRKQLVGAGNRIPLFPFADRGGLHPDTERGQRGGQLPLHHSPAAAELRQAGPHQIAGAGRFRVIFRRRKTAGHQNASLRQNTIKKNVFRPEYKPENGEGH